MVEEDEDYYNDQPFPSAILGKGARIPDDASEMIRQPLTMDCLRDSISTIKPGTAPGKDGMFAEMWRDEPECLLQVLLDAINNTLRTGRMPDEWRGCTVRLLLKKEQSTMLCNWRPVCLLQLAYKIYARTINSRLKALADKYQLLTMVQEGF